MGLSAYEIQEQEAGEVLLADRAGREEMSAVRQDDLQGHGIRGCRTGENTGQERAEEMVAEVRKAVVQEMKTYGQWLDDRKLSKLK